MEQGILLSAGADIDFMVHGVFSYELFGQTVWITTTHICVLIVMLVMLLVFSVAYPLTISRMGFQYRGEILVPQVPEKQTVYSGRVNGQKASFTVTSDGTITCQMGDKAYGPPMRVQVSRQEVSNYTKAKSCCSGAALRTGMVNAGRMTEMEI